MLLNKSRIIGNQLSVLKNYPTNCLWVSKIVKLNTQECKCFQTGPIYLLRGQTKIQTLTKLQTPNINEQLATINQTEDVKEVVKILMSLYSSAKNKEINLESKNKEIENLCEAIYKNIRKLDIGEIVMVLNMLSHLKIHYNTMVMQTTMQMIRMRINDLTPKQIMLVHKILMKAEKTHLGEALKKSLPIVFQSVSQHQLYGQDIRVLSSALLYSIRNRLPQKTTVMISNLIEDDISNLNVEAAQNIIAAMEESNKSHYYCRNMTYKALMYVGKEKKIKHEKLIQHYYSLFPKQPEETLVCDIADKDRCHLK